MRGAGNFSAFAGGCVRRNWPRGQLKASNRGKRSRSAVCGNARVIIFVCIRRRNPELEEKNAQAGLPALQELT